MSNGKEYEVSEKREFKSYGDALYSGSELVGKAGNYGFSWSGFDNTRALYNPKYDDSGNLQVEGEVGIHSFTPVGGKEEFYSLANRGSSSRSTLKSAGQKKFLNLMGGGFDDEQMKRWGLQKLNLSDDELSKIADLQTKELGRISYFDTEEFWKAHPVQGTEKPKASISDKIMHFMNRLK